MAIPNRRDLGAVDLPSLSAFLSWAMLVRFCFSSLSAGCRTWNADAAVAAYVSFSIAFSGIENAIGVQIYYYVQSIEPCTGAGPRRVAGWENAGSARGGCRDTFFPAGSMVWVSLLPR